MPKDVFGINYWYASKTDGFKFEATDPENQNHFEGSDNVTYQSGSEFTMQVSGATSCFITRTPGFTETSEGCDEDFADNEERGYANSPDDIKDIEMKMLISIENGGAHGLSISGPTGRHKSNSSPCCGGNAYMFSMEYDENPAVFRFRKEMWHVSYHDDPKTGQWTHPLVNFALNEHGWIGIGYVRYNLKDGVSTGKDAVVLEGWFNPDPVADLNNWTMLKRTIDTGGWGDDGEECGGDSDQILTWGGVKFRIKSNDESADIHIKNLSLREIDPTKNLDDTGTDPEEPPEEPPQQVTTIQGAFRVQWDVNQLRVSPCAGAGGGGGGGSAVFYSVTGDGSDVELSDSTTFLNRTGVGERCTTSSSILAGKIIKQLDVSLKKVGTPGASPTIGAKLFTDGGSVIYTSPTTLDPSTLTTSYAKYTFDFSTNTHTMVTGDRIGITYTGTSSSNYVMTEHTGTDIVPNSNYFAIKNGLFVGTNAIDWAVDMWQ